VNNAAFIDVQNLYQGMKVLGWKINWRRLRIYLKDKYKIKIAYVFIGHIPSQKKLYANLHRAGYALVFKPVVVNSRGEVKGNCDADLVLKVLLEKENYDQAVLITSDGDFYSLVRYLFANNKLAGVLSPHINTCSSLLKKEARGKISYFDGLKSKIGEK
jgi:uncharacterized LabA/DUF88 family protein